MTEDADHRQPLSRRYIDKVRAALGLDEDVSLLGWAEQYRDARLRASDERLREASKPRDEGDPLPQISFDYGGRDVWHTDCPGQHHAPPMKHLKGRLPIGDGVVLYEYECTACRVRVFGGCDKAGRIVRRASLPSERATTPEETPAHER